MKKTRVAICYDFDGTLIPGIMQGYDFTRKIGLDVPTFLERINKIRDNTHTDDILAYMRLMLQEAAAKNIPFRKKELCECGKNLPLFPGVETWFDRINKYGKKHGLTVEHYVISSGLTEIIMGNPISKNFKHVYASSFMYDEKGDAVWPAMAINYTAKTQFIFRINKGCLNINDPEINAFIPDSKRYIPLSHMIYVGDGLTDVPCMRLVKNENGHSIAVYESDDAKAKKVASQLLNEGRVNFTAKADYSPNSMMEKIVQTILDKIKLDLNMENLKKQCKTSK
ncbi:MAG: haloacid dehalogenase-like hydrolase [Alphaproteobacteria bacterium]|nr:haloacid dehalogenase-like hydrolase [Alphaproteobacteria bacterium]